MPLNIKHPEADRLARAVARATGQTITEAVISALQEHLRRVEGRSDPRDLVEELMAISRRSAAIPDRYPELTDEELLGFDEHGAFGDGD